MENSLYRDEILQEYRAARRAAPIASFTDEARASNPLCGDSLTVRLFVENDIVKAVSAESVGCVVSTVAANRFLERIRGKTREEARACAEDPHTPLFPVPLLPVRMKCARLVLEAAKKIL